MPVNVGGASGVGELAPVQPLGDPLSGYPGLQRINNQPPPGLPGLTGQESLQRQLGLGSMESGPTNASAILLRDPSTFTVAEPAPPLLSTPLNDIPGKIRSGAIDLNLIDPLNLPTQLTGSAIGVNQPLVGNTSFKGTNAIDPMRFLAQRDVEPLVNGPSRLLDYAVAPAVVLFNHLTNQGTGGPATDGAGLAKYAFQKDPAYWPWVGGATDDMLAQQARLTATQYDSSGARGALYKSLLDQFKSDRDQMTGLSSGNAGVDYAAKKNLAAILDIARKYNISPNDAVAALAQTPDNGGMQAFNGIAIPSLYGDGLQATTNLQRDLSVVRGQVGVGLGSVPLLGDLWRSLQPQSADTEAAWAALDTNARRYLLQLGMGQGNAASMMVTLPLLSGAGAVLAIGKTAAEAGASGAELGLGSKVLAGSYTAYNTGLNVMTQAMKVGLGVALTNWGLEIASPTYNELVGHEIDQAQPFSRSQFAAQINLIGYFASPVEVFKPYLGAVAGPLKAIVGAGLTEIPIYRSIGGAEGTRTALAVYRDSAGNALPVQGLDMSVRRLTLSETTSWIRDQNVRMWEDALQGRREVADPVFNALPVSERAAYASDRLMEMEGTLHDQAASIFETIDQARKPLPAGATEADRIVHGQLGAFARATEDTVARRYQTNYDAAFWRPKLAEYSVDGFKGWLTKQADRMGLTLDMPALEKRIGGITGYLPDRLTGGADERLLSWQSFAQKMYHYEYDQLNGELQAVAAGTEEASRITLVRNTHIFNDQAVRLIDAVKNKDPEAAAVARHLVTTTEEGGAWWTRFEPRSGVKNLDELDPKALAEHLSEVLPTLMQRRIPPNPAEPTATMPLNAFHVQLNAGEEWTLAYKPQYAHFDGEGLAPAGYVPPAGEPSFVAVHHLDDNTFFVSPYLDYPMESADLVHTGSQGFVASRLDSLTRGWRTWNIGEFQKALSFRIIGRYDGIVADQIDTFYREVMQQAEREQVGVGILRTHVNPQALAATQRLEQSVRNVEGSIEKIAHRIFGEGELLNLDTGLMEKPDWPMIVERSFRQSLRMNTTAGVTSRLKLIPHGIGDAAILTSDVIVPLIRFSLSGLFRVGEYIESKMLNGMRGIVAAPMQRILYGYGGIYREVDAAGHEIAADPMAGFLANNVAGPGYTRASESAFLTRRPGGSPTPAQAAPARDLAISQAPAIDMPGGPDAPAPTPKPTDAALAEYQAAAEQLHHLRLADRLGLIEADPARIGMLRDAEARYEGAREALLAEYRPSWQQAKADWQARVDEWTTRHDQPAQPISPRDPSVENLRRAQASYADAEARTADNPDDYQAMADLFAAADARDTALADMAKEGPPPATDLAAIPGTPEHLESLIDAHGTSLKGSALDAFKRVWNPQSMKQQAQQDLAIKVFRDSFPAILKASGSRAVDVLRGLHVPEGEWTEFLLADRSRLQEWTDTGTREAFDKLTAKADAYRGASPESAADADALYSSPEWDTVSSLWRANIQAAQDEAFGVHFFSRYRSTFGRTINHPLLGAYPAAWALKVAKEWFRFLYDNHTFGPLRLGMTPAVAIHQITEAQNRLFAMNGDGSAWQDYISWNGPLGNSIFIFNLLLPGDWSAIPFPLSRSIRLMLRGDFNPADHIAENLWGGTSGGGIGAIRDLRLYTNSGAELLKAWNQTPGSAEKKFDGVTTVNARGGLPSKPADWRSITSYPLP